MGIKETLAAKAALSSTQELAAAALGKKTEVITGAVNSVSALPINAAAIAKAKLDLSIKPIKKSIDQVLFATKKLNFGSATEDGIRFRFNNGYLLTDNAKLIAFIRKNADLPSWQITEDKTPPTKEGD